MRLRATPLIVLPSFSHGCHPLVTAKTIRVGIEDRLTESGPPDAARRYC